MILRGKVPTIIFDALHPDLDKMMYSDSDILKLANPDSVDWEIRIRMARIISKVTLKSKTVYEEIDFYRGICERVVFRKRLMHEWKGAFLVRPLHTFEQATDHIITAITARFYEIAALPVTTTAEDGTKTVDHRNARLLMDLAKLMLDRKHGSAIQRQVTLKSSIPASVAVDPVAVENEIIALEAEFAEQARIPSKTEGEEETEGTTPVSGK